MKRLLISFGIGIAILVRASFVNADMSNGSKVAMYVCDDGLRDAGYLYNLTDFSVEVQEVRVIEKSKIENKVRFGLRIHRTESPIPDLGAKFYGEKQGLTLSLLMPPRVAGRVQAVTILFADEAGTHGPISATCTTEPPS